MATKIIMNDPSKTTDVQWLEPGDCFLEDGELFMWGCDILRANGGRSSGYISSTRLKDGAKVKFSKTVPVEPVDIEIKVVRK